MGLYFILLFVFIGFLLSVTQFFGESPDYSQYDDFFDLVRSEGLDTLVVSRFEPGFSIFTVLLTTLFTTNVVVYGWIVVAAMLLKGWAINAYSSSQKIFLVVAIFYLVRYFPLHELTQLRAACAIALILVGAIILWRGNYFLGILICTSALLFQMSAIAVIPALFLSSSKRWQVILSAFLAFVLIHYSVDYLINYLGNFIQIVGVYLTVGFGEDSPNPLSVALIIDWAMISISLIMWNRLSLIMKRVIFLEIIGMAIFYGGLEFAVISHRIREFYSVFWVLFVADGLRQKNTKIVSYGFIILCFFVYAFVYFFREPSFFGK